MAEREKLSLRERESNSFIHLGQERPKHLGVYRGPWGRPFPLLVLFLYLPGAFLMFLLVMSPADKKFPSQGTCLGFPGPPVDL